jgi:hypothetical protein
MARSPDPARIEALALDTLSDFVKTRDEMMKTAQEAAIRNLSLPEEAVTGQRPYGAIPLWLRDECLLARHLYLAPSLTYTKPESFWDATHNAVAVERIMRPTKIWRYKAWMILHTLAARYTTQTPTDISFPLSWLRICLSLNLSETPPFLVASDDLGLIATSSVIVSGLLTPGRRDNAVARANHEAVLAVLGPNDVSVSSRIPGRRPPWITGQAIELAVNLYEKARLTGPTPELDVEQAALDQAGLLILADACEEAGCDHALLLQALRNSPNPVYRGFWPVDYILGLPVSTFYGASRST